MFATVMSWIVVVLHFVFGYAESFGWSKMARRFGYTAEGTELTRRLALNQGAYNVGLACVLAWALVTGHGPTATAMLAYVVAMAVVGAASVRWTIFVIQGIPASIALAATLLRG
jgi:putative membrane protein